MNMSTYGCQNCGKEWVIVTGPVPDHGCFECCTKFLGAGVLENYAALRLALETATKERDEARAQRTSWHVEAEAWQMTATNIQERLDQFDAHGMPNVAAALDRIAKAEAERDAAVARLNEALPPEVRGAAEIVCPDTLSAERRCGACPTCRCITEVERLRAAIQAHEHEFERLTLRPDPCDYDLWGALAACRGDA